MERILGIDVGTNSLGLTLRENDEFIWYGVYTFRKGVGEGKAGEFSLAAERTKHRSTRRLYNARRYRKWETLKVLIENDYCPLSEEALKKWKYYEKGVGRTFPVNDYAFNQWIKLDFNNDGVPDYSSPYQLRRELITHNLDLSIAENRYKIGRALYHIAQRRGFKSSRKSGANEKTAVYKGSNETKTIGRNEYENLIIENGSLGAAFAFLEDDGIRIRNRYTLRSDYQAETHKILQIQNLSDTEFATSIDKAIFFQRPLRSQKGLVGKCTLEPNKPRSPISHPKFEEFRAWTFINNIKFRSNSDEQFKPIPLELKEKIYHEKFFYKSKRDFKFSEIRKFIIANGGKDWELNYSKRMDEISVPSCYVSARFKSVFGEDWQNIEIKTDKIKKDKYGNERSIVFNVVDIWHILFSYEDEENFIEFLDKTLQLNEDQIKELIILFNAFPVGYANLSLKAIDNINPFLRLGMIYSEAVILAKIPELIGKEVFEDNKTELIKAVENEIENNRYEKMLVAISNNLIFKYHALEYDEKFAYKNFSYQLSENDRKDIVDNVIEHFGNKTWSILDENFRNKIIDSVSENYQNFFADPKREHIKPPHLVNQIKEFLSVNFNISERLTNKIYHPSQIDIYPKKEGQRFLLSPKTAAFKNPMAYKTLYKLRDVINHLINEGMIDEETRIIIEIARELNDSNKRWAIEKYQRDRENENREFVAAITELIKDPEFKGFADPNSKTDNDKFRLWTEQIDSFDEILKEIQSIDKDKNISVSQKDIQKYRLWKEQSCVCMYTGKIINLTDLFDQNKVDFEHTIPRSKSFDNSLANLTVCYADYNRNIKDNKIPTQLPNYYEESHNYTAIEPRLEKWKMKVDDLYNQIEFWKSKSRAAMDKSAKDDAIRQRHLRQMDYDYWRNKLERFTQTEITTGFVRSQLVDTQIISKYAFHYLKTVFNKVDVQKGTNTSQFRKIFGIQPKLESKDRSKHFHHAIDAAVLTLIPSASKREEILKKAYEYEERNFGKQFTQKPFSTFKYSMLEEIEKNILINNISDKDQTLTPGKKIVRKRGRIVWIDKEKRILKMAQGDSVRGELHQQTYYGKIKVAAKDEKGSLLKDDDGKIIYNQVDGKDEIWMVIRKPVESVNFSTDVIVDEHLSNHLKEQIKKGVKPHELMDFQGNKLRRLRCRVKSGRGFMNPDNVTVVKEQTYKSEKEYKNFIYADSGDNFMFGLYENENGRKIISINTFDAVSKYTLSQNKDKKEDIFKSIEPIYIGTGKKKLEAKLKHIFMVGQKVLFFIDRDDPKNELNGLTKEELSKRLYFIKRLADANQGLIQFQHHLEARTDEELNSSFPVKDFGSKGKNGFSVFSTDFIAPRLLLSVGNFNFIIEEKDFEMNLDGSIKFRF